jgi:hypothetical protein
MTCPVSQLESRARNRTVAAAERGPFELAPLHGGAGEKVAREGRPYGTGPDRVYDDPVRSKLYSHALCE